MLGNIHMVLMQKAKSSITQLTPIIVTRNDLFIRQSNKDAKKEDLMLQEKRELIHTLNDFALQLERQDAQLREMSRVVADLGTFQTTFIF